MRVLRIAVKAELKDAHARQVPVWRGDLDFDGVEEIVLSSPAIKLALKLDANRLDAAAFDAEGYVRVDDDSRVLDRDGRPIPGLYCAGDLARGWNQIPEAWAQAERAMIHAYASYL